MLKKLLIGGCFLMLMGGAACAQSVGSPFNGWAGPTSSMNENEATFSLMYDNIGRTKDGRDSLTSYNFNTIYDSTSVGVQNNITASGGSTVNGNTQSGTTKGSTVSSGVNAIKGDLNGDISSIISQQGGK